jgi:hypothetical protein
VKKWMRRYEACGAGQAALATLMLADGLKWDEMRETPNRVPRNA